jgi:hypothetical protein
MMQTVIGGDLAHSANCSAGGSQSGLAPLAVWRINGHPHPASSKAPINHVAGTPTTELRCLTSDPCTVYQIRQGLISLEYPIEPIWEV